MPEQVVNRIKNWRTTLIGSLVMIFGVVMLVFKVLCWAGVSKVCDFTVVEVLSTITLGYSFIMAKDSLLEGITLGLFKMKKP